MKIRRTTATYGVLVLLALFFVMTLVISIGVDRTTHNSTPATVNLTRAPIPSNNNTVSNANSRDRQPSGTTTSKELPTKYPTLAPAKPLSQTVNGYTVTLYPMYANANLVVLTYTVQSSFEDLSKVSDFERLHGEEQQPITEIYKPSLTSDGGHVVPWLRDIGLQLYMNLATSSLVFDGRQLTANLPGKVQLHLTLNRARVPIPLKQGGATLREVKGPFIFDFSVPVDPLRRIAEVNQTVVTPQGDKVTISKVIVTRHDVRVIWRLDSSATAQSSPTAELYAHELYACCTLKLELGDHSTDSLNDYSRSQRKYGDRENVLINNSLLGEQGEWAISMWYFSTYTGNMYYPPMPGPVFRFSVPPAINPLQP